MKSEDTIDEKWIAEILNRVGARVVDGADMQQVGVVLESARTLEFGASETFILLLDHELIEDAKYAYKPHGYTRGTGLMHP